MADLKLNDELWLSSALAPNYTKLEYIASTGTQYIDTTVMADSKTKIEAKLYTTETGNKNWFGGSSGTGANNFVFNSYSTTQLEYQYGTSDTWSKSTVSNIVGSIFTVEFGDGALKINNSSIATLSTTWFKDTVTTKLFVRHGGSSYISGRIYYCKIYKNSELVRNFIPAKRNSDGAIGLFDLITNIFYLNAGTGTFVAGSESSSIPLSHDFFKIKNIAGNLKLVAYGQTDSISVPKTTWGGRGLNAVTISFDEEYIKRTAVNTNNFTVVKTGMYFIFWTSRLLNSGASAGAGLNINEVYSSPGDDRFCWGSGTTPRSMIIGVQGEQYSAGTTISTTMYSDAAQRMNPVAMWIFVVA